MKYRVLIERVNPRERAEQFFAPSLEQARHQLKLFAEMYPLEKGDVCRIYKMTEELADTLLG
jgi:hypothetical protein